MLYVGSPVPRQAAQMYRRACAKRPVCLLQTELRREALHLAEEFRERNRTALLNLLSDSTIALTGFILLLRNSDGRGALFGTIGRVFSGFSDTAKAFLIIACKRLGLCSPRCRRCLKARSAPSCRRHSPKPRSAPDWRCTLCILACTSS